MLDMGTDWKRLAEHVIRRRVAIGYQHRRAFAAAIKVTDRTLSKLEEGEPVGRNTLAAVEVGLRWKPGSMDAVLEGGEPTPAVEELDGSSCSAERVAANAARRLDATEYLREHSIFIEDGSRFSVEQLEALAAVVHAFKREA